MSLLSVRLDALAQALHRLASQPLTTGLALALATLSLLLPLLVATLAAPLAAAWGRFDAPAQAVVFVAAGTPSRDIEALRTQVAALPRVVDATHVTREAALEALARRAPGGSLPELKTNPLPDTIVVRLARATTAAEADGTIAALRKLGRVDAVQFDSAWYRRWTAGVRIGAAALAVGAAVLGGLCLLALVAACRLPSITGRDELRVLALVGAPPRQRRRPFAYAGALIGLAAGLLACAAVAATLAGLAPVLADVREATGWALTWPLLPWPVQAGVVAAGGLLGLVAGIRAGWRADAAGR